MREVSGVFVNCILSIVAATSFVGQGLGCFSSPIVIGEDERTPLQLLDMLLDGRWDKNWMEGAEMQARKTE